LIIRTAAFHPVPAVFRVHGTSAERASSNRAKMEVQSRLWCVQHLGRRPEPHGQGTTRCQNQSGRPVSRPESPVQRSVGPARPSRARDVHLEGLPGPAAHQIEHDFLEPNRSWSPCTTPISRRVRGAGRRRADALMHAPPRRSAAPPALASPAGPVASSTKRSAASSRAGIAEAFAGRVIHPPCSDGAESGPSGFDKRGPGQRTPVGDLLRGAMSDRDIGCVGRLWTRAASILRR
jgi:hypothetical protein